MIKPDSEIEKFPLISILIAARNEEENILDLLLSLEKLTYPKEKLQILIGNDASTDKTAEIIEDFISDKEYFKHIIIINPPPNKPQRMLGLGEATVATVLVGKANVLSQLAHHAKGEYFFFTDADIEVPKNWIENILNHFSTSKQENNQSTKQTGIVTGITLVKNKNWFEACQAIEWFFALKMMESLGKFKIPTTSMGNNMAVSAEAYWATGGYEKIKFSIVEDYALYKAIIEKGFSFKQLFDESVMTLTKPPKNYFEQRKRWVSGGMTSGSNLIIPSFIQGIALPILLIISIFSWKFSLLVLFLNLIINFFVGFKIFKKLNQMRLLKYIPAYTVYMYVFWFLQLISYFLPTKLVWKGREY